MSPFYFFRVGAAGDSERDMWRDFKGGGGGGENANLPTQIEKSRTIGRT